jgi:cbb3-type cytochrome oxidase subunit 3
LARLPLSAEAALKNSRFAIFLLAMVFMVAWAPGALACAVCFDSGEENRLAFTITTWFLTFLPLFFIGGVIYWLVKRVKSAESELDDAAQKPLD